MKINFKKILFTLGLLSLAGCYAGDKTLVPQPPYEPVEIEESYSLKFEPKVDIIFVVDNSGSMSTHQQNLASNIALFTDSMDKNSFIDYHIGVISTDMDDPAESGRLQGSPAFVSKETDMGMQVLARSFVSLGTSGNYIEKMAEPLYAALGPGSERLNPGFLRSEAFLVVILVTDAEDQSEGITGFKVYDALLRKKGGDKERVLGYAVLSYPNLFGDRCSKDGGDDPVLNELFMSFFTNAHNSKIAGNLPPLPGSRARLTNMFSLCDIEYGQKLANIGEDIRYRVSQRIPLPKLPVRGTIKLKYGSQYVDEKWWSYDPTSQSLNLDPDIELIEEEGAQFSVVLDQSNPDETIGVPTEDDLPFTLED